MVKERLYRYNNSELIIRFGDIIESDTDAIVCSDDYMLSASAGASKAIRSVAGDVIMHDVRKKSGGELGDVVVTTAGNLPHKFLFHCITGGKSDTAVSEERAQLEEYIIQHSISKCLHLLTALDLYSIAIPPIGAGYAGFDFERVGKVMAEVISNFLLLTNKKYHIEIYLYGKRDDMMDYIAFYEQFALRVPTTNDFLFERQMKSKEDDIKTEYSKEYDVFISYSRLDKEKTDMICQYLDKYGINYWIDREGVHHGNNFKVEIIEAIQASKVLIFVSSVNSNKSPNTIKEVSIAEKYGKVVIPIRIDDSAYDKSLEYDLCNKDWMNFQENVDYDASAMTLYENLIFYIGRDVRKK